MKRTRPSLSPSLQSPLCSSNMRTIRSCPFCAAICSGLSHFLPVPGPGTGPAAASVVEGGTGSRTVLVPCSTAVLAGGDGAGGNIDRAESGRIIVMDFGRALVLTWMEMGAAESPTSAGVPVPSLPDEKSMSVMLSIIGLPPCPRWHHPSGILSGSVDAAGANGGSPWSRSLLTAMAKKSGGEGGPSLAGDMSDWCKRSDLCCASVSV